MVKIMVGVKKVRFVFLLCGQLVFRLNLCQPWKGVRYGCCSSVNYSSGSIELLWDCEAGVLWDVFPVANLILCLFQFKNPVGL